MACDCIFVVADLRLLASCRLLAAGAGQAEGWQSGLGWSWAAPREPREGSTEALGSLRDDPGIALGAMG